jgi:heparan-alpha-glucosaminide N-acetyltransferase
MEVQPPRRVESIDVLRGLTILVMIFVNDVAGVHGAPSWMRHLSPSDGDGMTFVDVVFPAFLFIVGMSIPFAIGGRLGRGESLWSVWRHIVIRTASLLIIGVFMVNTESTGKDGFLSPSLWSLLMYLGVILCWKAVPRDPGRNRRLAIWLRVTGIALLVVMALLFRGTGERSLTELRPHWWGILGLIGWAYLVSCLAYVLLRRQMAGLLGVVALLYCVFLADRAGFFAGLTLITDWIQIGSMLGSHSAITLSGVILGLVLHPDSPHQSHAGRIRWGFLFGLGLAAAGILLHSLNGIHPMFIINKIAATPPWCLLSSAFTVWVWVVVYWLVDVRGLKGWAVAVGPAGSNALFAYILAPIIGCLISLLSSATGSNFYARLGESFEVGFWRSVVFAFAVTWLAGGLRRAGVSLKL